MGAASGCPPRAGDWLPVPVGPAVCGGKSGSWATVWAGTYPGGMSVMREELHHLIDQLPEEQVAPMLALVRDSLPVGDEREAVWPLPSFVGTLASGKGDVAGRSQEILREEMGRDAR